MISLGGAENIFDRFLQALIGVIPTKTPQLSRVTYEFVLAHYLRHDIQVCSRRLFTLQ